MIRHCVYMNLKPDHDPVELRDVLAGLKDLCAQLPGTSGFWAGPNRDFERKSQQFAAGFTIDFAHEEALHSYADSPRHQALGARLVAQCTGGAHGVMVFDIEHRPE